ALMYLKNPKATNGNAHFNPSSLPSDFAALSSFEYDDDDGAGGSVV
ncbi:hypothetical protein A2U01_0097521, partial [Trifolium medium]|nr:hypothetical protein [Trifolium medium]